MTSSPEIWKPVEGYRGVYEVSSHGRVRSLDRLGKDGRRLKGRVLRPGLTGSGYRQVSLYDAEGRSGHLVHHLVADAFLGDSREGRSVNHKNGHRTDDRVENLRVVPHRECIVRVYSRPRSDRRGERASGARLSEMAVRIIRRLRGRMPSREIAEVFGINASHARGITRGESWSHVPLQRGAA